MKHSRIIISFCIGIVFFVLGILDLPNYGANWDEPVHFGRGQAILHYFLTGKKDYKELIPTQALRRSYYQHDSYSYTFFEQKFDENKPFSAGTGHPVVSDVLAALSNRIFYQTLNVIGDIESYHVYSVATAAFLLGVLYFFTSSLYGSFAGFVSVLSLALTPLFLGESRFNIKDVPEAVLYACTMLAFYQGVVKNNWKWIILSSFFAGLAFGTKINIVFALVSIALWLALFRSYIRQWAALVLYPVLPIIIYFGSWPILWKDPVNRFLYNLNYYKTIGTAGGAFAEFNTPIGLNTYAIQWIFFSTPLVILALSSIGAISGVRAKRNRSFFLLVLLWLLVPILRVSLPGLVIYGGVRQIMEYIPALAILAGVGAGFLVEKLKNVRVIVQAVILLSFLPITVKIVSLHPNESVYFNPLIGGLAGAAAKNFPGWGNSLGSTYRQGVRWLNANAEPNAKLGFIYELRSNIAEKDLRRDVVFSNQVRSAIQRKGEYIIGVTHEGTQEGSYHRKYLDRFLQPVYSVTVEGVPVLKIWKNDMEHSKPEYQKQEVMIKEPLVFRKNGTLTVDLGEVRKITKISIAYPDDLSCTPPAKGYFQYSKDGISYYREAADFSFFPLASWFKTQPKPGILQFLFAAESARYIQAVVLDEQSCLFAHPVDVEVSTL